MTDPLFWQRAVVVAAAAVDPRARRSPPGRPRRGASPWPMEERVAALLGPRQHTALVRARWAVIVAMRRRGSGSTAIARKLNRDRTTVLYGSRRGEALLAQDTAFAELVARVEAA